MVNLTSWDSSLCSLSLSPALSTLSSQVIWRVRSLSKQLRGDLSSPKSSWPDKKRTQESGRPLGDKSTHIGHQGYTKGMAVQGMEKGSLRQQATPPPPPTLLLVERDCCFGCLLSCNRNPFFVSFLSHSKPLLVPFFSVDHSLSNSGLPPNKTTAYQQGEG